MLAELGVEGFQPRRFGRDRRAFIDAFGERLPPALPR
jgi:hypothetical protein